MIRPSIKTAFACWIGIFLILPGCLCQLLSCVGIDLHGGGERHGQVPKLFAPNATSFAECHCDEDTGKVAESSPTGRLVESEFTAAETIDEGLLVPAAAPFSRLQSTRAPPPVLRAPASEFRALVSVWLI